MTIYTPSQTDKKPDKDSSGPEVVTEPLTSFKDEEADDVEMTAKAVRVNYFQRSRRSFCIHLLLTIMVLVILACGAIGAVVFYRHLNKKVYSGVCGNVYFDATYHEQSDLIPEVEPMASKYTDDNTPQSDYFEEGIEVSEVDMYEQLYTPAFDEVRENYVWHDFYRNYTAIVDHTWRRCYVMKLNRTAIAPPKDLIDLLDKLVSGYYMPKAKVIRENYRMVYPPLSDLEPLGRRIQNKCAYYDTYWLEQFVSGVVKRSTETVSEETITYAILSNHPHHQEIYKIVIHNIKTADKNEGE